MECIVAPYEADAQLTYLQKEGIVDVVITEDSDLLVFGCQRVRATWTIAFLSHSHTHLSLSLILSLSLSLSLSFSLSPALRCCIRWMTVGTGN